MAVGAYTAATGYYSAALGYTNTASGSGSTALGSYTVALGTYATSLGYSTTARSYGVTAIGTYNTDNGSSFSWVPTDPLFIIGNGTGVYQKSNAFTVFKNGTADLGGSAVVTSSTFPTLLGTQLANTNSNLTFTSTANRAVTISQSTSGAGRTLTVQAGAAAANSSDQAGGTLVLASGGSTGNGGSAIEFRTAAAGASGTSQNVATTRLRINAAGGIEAGEGLNAAAAPQFVAGKYNNTANDATGNHGQGLFVIGAGTGPGASAKNAMRVLEDGTILIQQKGDLLMGAFGGGEQP